MDGETKKTYSSPLKISIITPVLNRADCIAQAIESVRSQIHPNVEHVVIDGASTDGTLEILECNLADSAKLLSEKDTGIYDALNKGLVLASGEIIGLMHSDDFFASESTLKEVAVTFDNQNIDAVYGDAVFFHRKNPKKIIRKYRSDQFHFEKLSWGWMPAHTTLFLHRRVFEKYGLYRTDYKIAADFEFVARIFKSDALKAVYLPKVLVHMRLGGMSSGGIKSTIQLNREVMRACRENGIDTNMMKIISKYPLKVLEFLCS